MFASSHVFSFVKCRGVKAAYHGEFTIWRKQEMVFWAILQQMGFSRHTFERNWLQYCLGADV